MTKKIMLVFTILALLAFTAVGCAPTRKPMPPGPQPTRPNPTTPAPRQQVPLDSGNAALQQRATKIAENVDKIQGVKKSHIVISENTGYIGLDLDRSLEGNRVEKIKKEAEAQAKKADTKLRTIMVTTDVDSVERIKKVGEGIKSGKPLSGFAKEIEEIGRRLKPSTEM